MKKIETLGGGGGAPVSHRRRGVVSRRGEEGGEGRSPVGGIQEVCFLVGIEFEFLVWIVWDE